MSSRPSSARQAQQQRAAPVKQTKPKTNPEDALVVAANLKNNLQVLGYFRSFIAVVVGSIVGILGFTGWYGFIYHIATQLLCTVPMLFKSNFEVKKYFYKTNTLLLESVFGSTNFLSYILFWMIFYNMCHIF